MKYCVYILKSSKDDSLYVGLTANLRKRLREHKIGYSGFTKSHLPYKLMFYSVFPNKYIAAKFEKYLKTASGKAFLKKRLIN